MFDCMTLVIVANSHIDVDKLYTRYIHCIHCTYFSIPGTCDMLHRWWFLELELNRERVHLAKACCAVAHPSMGVVVYGTIWIDLSWKHAENLGMYPNRWVAGKSTNGSPFRHLWQSFGGDEKASQLLSVTWSLSKKPWGPIVSHSSGASGANLTAKGCFTVMIFVLGLSSLLAILWEIPACTHFQCQLRKHPPPADWKGIWTLPREPNENDAWTWSNADTCSCWHTLLSRCHTLQWWQGGRRVVW